MTVYNEEGAWRGQRHIPSKHYPKYNPHLPGENAANLIAPEIKSCIERKKKTENRSAS